MNYDRMEGKLNDVKGRVKRQVGEWTGDEEAQAEGTLDQAKGKTQNAWGKIKDEARELKDDIMRDPANDDVRPNRDRDDKVA